MSALALRLSTAGLDELMAKAQKVGEEKNVALAAAVAVANLTRAHLFNLDARSPRTHFYSQAAKSIEAVKPDMGGASFTINKVGLAQRWLGGTIKAGAGTSSKTGGPTKYLAIGTDEAQGHTPKEVSMEQDLAFIPRGHGKAMLVQGMQTISTRGKTKGQTITRAVPGGLVLFWLVPSVDQQPDPSVMPSDRDMEAEAVEHGGNYLARILASN